MPVLFKVRKYFFAGFGAMRLYVEMTRTNRKTDRQKRQTEEHNMRIT